MATGGTCIICWWMRSGDSALGPRLTVLVMGAASLGFIGLHALMQGLLHSAGLGGFVIGLAFIALAGLYLATRRHVVRALARALATRRDRPGRVIGPAE